MIAAPTIYAQISWSFEKRTGACQQGPKRVLDGFDPLPPLLFLLDAIDPDDAEAGVFTSNFLMKLARLGVVRLNRVYIRKLWNNHTIGRREPLKLIDLLKPPARNLQPNSLIMASAFGANSFV